MSIDDTAQFIRHELAEAIRKGPYSVSCLLAGFEGDEPRLYWLDYLGSVIEVSKAAHGYAEFLISSVLDTFQTKDLTEEQGLRIIDQCLISMRDRFVISQTSFTIKGYSNVIENGDAGGQFEGHLEALRKCILRLRRENRGLRADLDKEKRHVRALNEELRTREGTTGEWEANLMRHQVREQLIRQKIELLQLKISISAQEFHRSLEELMEKAICRAKYARDRREEDSLELSDDEEI
ncbi:unnamed protein product [Sphagnum balticum]